LHMAVFTGISLSVLPLKAQEVPQWKARAAYSFQAFSFAPNAHGANFLLTYDRARAWGVRGGGHYINKFGDSAPGGDLGGTYWATPTTTLALDAEFAPGHFVIPRQAYTFEVSQVVFEKLVPAIAYRFADYRDADAHIIMPSFTWYFFRRWDWMVRYFFSVSLFGRRSFTNHSAMTRLNWNIIDPVWLFAGYARGNESFDAGSLFKPFRRFSADHIFSGGKWEFYKGLGIDATYDFENRSNDSTLHTVDLGIFYRW
jgi:YaiO family outer membrane protein